MGVMKFVLTGISPLLMHNERLADPLDEIAGQISEINSKRGKTKADHVEMSRLEWLGGLYLMPSPKDASRLVPCVPAVNVEACIRDGAKKRKKGKDVTAALTVVEDAEIQIGNITSADMTGDIVDFEKLWKNSHFRDRRGVKVQRSKVFRTRPVFKEWSIACELLVDDYVLEAKEVQEYVELAGRYAGLGDWRPRFGRFSCARF